MALASSRRPQIVEEELQVAATAVPKKIVNLYSTFLDVLGSWYLHMKPSDKAKLTPKRLKRRAVVILERLYYPYSSLPHDWVATAVERFGIKLYRKHKKPRPVEVPADVDIKFSIDPLAVMRGVPAKLEGVAVNGKIVDSEDELKFSKENGESSSVEGEMREMPERKKLLDLSDLPPPGDWVDAHAKGIFLPRELTLYSGDGQTVLFYDYSPKLKPKDPSMDLSKYKSRVHEQNNFSWIPLEHRQAKDRREEAVLRDYSQNAAVESIGPEEVSVSVSPPIQIPSVCFQDSEAACQEGF